MTAGIVTPLRDPVRVGTGPAVFSTCTALALARARDRWIVDSNGYYRTLGVSPDASRAELRAAYLRLGGPDSPELTHALAQLLDRETRAAYDRAPLGRPYMDRSTQDAAWTAVLRAAGTKLTEEVVKGFFEVDNGFPPLRQGPQAQADPAHCNGYGYYLWRTTAAGRDLARWQALVIRAMSERGIVAQVAVGVMGGTDQPVVRARTGGVDVCYLHESVEPTWALAVAVTTAVRTHRAIRTHRTQRSIA